MHSDESSIVNSAIHTAKVDLFENTYIYMSIRGFVVWFYKFVNDPIVVSMQITICMDTS